MQSSPSSKVKSKKYDTLAELYRAGSIKDSLLRDLGDSVEAIHNSESNLKSQQWLKLADNLPHLDQLLVEWPEQVSSLVFGKSLRQNSFFKDLPDHIVSDILASCHQLTVRAGEFVYHSDQISEFGSPCLCSLSDHQGESQLQTVGEHLLQSVCGRIFFWRHRTIQKVLKTVFSQGRRRFDSRCYQKGRFQ